MTTTTKPREDIIDLVRKLMALAQNDGATEAEAANAAGRAQRLIDLHEIEQRELEAKGSVATEGYVEVPYVFSPAIRQRAWRAQLFFNVAVATHCRAFVYTGTNRGTLLGKPHLLEITKYFIESLGGAIEALGHRELLAQRKTGHEFGTRTHAGYYYLRSYCLGVVATVTRRLQEQHSGSKVPAGVKALVVVTTAELDAAQAELVGTVRTARSGKSLLNREGWYKGLKDGEGVAIAPAIAS